MKCRMERPDGAPTVTVSSESDATRSDKVDLKNKVAIVTGAAVGTGRATAIALAQRGCHIVANYSKSSAEAQATVDSCRQLGVRAVALRADVADDAAVRSMVEQTVAELGGLHV